MNRQEHMSAHYTHIRRTNRNCRTDLDNSMSHRQTQHLHCNYRQLSRCTQTEDIHRNIGHTRAGKCKGKCILGLCKCIRNWS